MNTNVNCVIFHGQNSIVIKGSLAADVGALHALAQQWNVAVGDLQISPMLETYQPQIQLILHKVEPEVHELLPTSLPMDHKGNIGTGIVSTTPEESEWSYQEERKRSLEQTEDL